jgi:hypothetical protein
VRRYVHDEVGKELVVFLDCSCGERVTIGVSGIHRETDEDTTRCYDHETDSEEDNGSERQKLGYVCCKSEELQSRLVESRHGKVLLDAALVDPRHGEPEDRSTDEHNPEGVASGRVWIKTGRVCENLPKTRETLTQRCPNGPLPELCSKSLQHLQPI